MAEISKVWVVNNFYNAGNMAELFEDKAIKDDAHRLAQFCGALDDGGWDIDKFVRVYNGTGPAQWAKEKSKVYDNEADARKDAEKRLAALRKKYDKSKKTASELTEFQDALIAQKIASRVTGQ